jgi:cytidyltransferase-like protein
MVDNTKKVLVSGCFDLLHGGHIAFFKTAARYGKLYVSIGKDENLARLKGKAPYFSEAERKFMVGSIKYVHEAFISSGEGMLDFEPDMKRLEPDFFIVNSDGHTPDKERLCNELGVKYIILDRVPEPGLPARSSSATKKDLRFPFRLCLAGGWVDQPWVSEIHPGSVVVAQIFPDIDFNDRSGMATSSRKVALRLWDGQIPAGDAFENAKLLFGAENPPGTTYISGSQDHIGLLASGINRLYYDGGFWPAEIDSCLDPDTCRWLSDVLHLVPLEPRPAGYDPLKVMNLGKGIVRKLGEAGTLCWESILRKDTTGLGKGMTDTFLAWKEMLPCTVPDWVMNEMQTKYLNRYPGAITSGSGGGYAVVASETPVNGAIKIRVRY